MFTSGNKMPDALRIEMSIMSVLTAGQHDINDLDEAYDRVVDLKTTFSKELECLKRVALHYAEFSAIC